MLLLNSERRVVIVHSIPIFLIRGRALNARSLGAGLSSRIVNYGCINSIGI